MKDFGAEKSRNKEIILDKKADWLLKFTFFQGMASMHLADYLSSAHQATLIDWFKITFLQEPKEIKLNLSLVTRCLA